MGNSPRTAAIHVLDDDSLLEVFYLYRPPMVVGDGKMEEPRTQVGCRPKYLCRHPTWVSRFVSLAAVSPPNLQNVVMSIDEKYVD